MKCDFSESYLKAEWQMPLALCYFHYSCMEHWGDARDGAAVFQPWGGMIMNNLITSWMER